jgi:hypothetical protein
VLNDPLISLLLGVTISSGISFLITLLPFYKKYYKDVKSAAKNASLRYLYVDDRK